MKEQWKLDDTSTVIPFQDLSLTGTYCNTCRQLRILKSKFGVNVLQWMWVCKIYEREPIRKPIELNEKTNWTTVFWFVQLRKKKTNNNIQNDISFITFLRYVFWETAWKLFSHMFLKKLEKLGSAWIYAFENIFWNSLNRKNDLLLYLLWVTPNWCVWCSLIFSSFDFLIPFERSSNTNKKEMVNHGNRGQLTIQH